MEIVSSGIVVQGKPGGDTREKRTMQDAWAEMADFSLGLPATAVAQNGDAVVVYCAGPATDQTDVKWIRIRAAANRLSHASSGQTGKLGHQFNPHG